MTTQSSTKPGSLRLSALMATVVGSIVGVASIAGVGCSDVPKATDQTTVVGPSLADFAALTGSVSGAFERNCASFDCHGNDAKPLRIYSQYGLRLPANFSTVNPPLSMEAGVDAGGGDDSGTITIPIEVDSGPAPVPGGIPTTAEERLANYQSIISLEPRLMDAVVNGGDPYQLLLLKKPLLIEPHKGGPALHKGGDGEKCIVSWLKGQVDKTACTTAGKFPADE